MIDRLGQLYNKDALLEYLIRRATNDDTESENSVARHVRNLKVRQQSSRRTCGSHSRTIAPPTQDVREVKLYKNPVQESELGEALYFPHACPLTQRVMNGKHKFLCLWPCGCVLSENGLRETCFPGKVKRDDTGPKECPQCMKPFQPETLLSEIPSIEADIVWLYPSADTVDSLREQLLAAARNKRKTKRLDSNTAKRARAVVVKDMQPGLQRDAPGTYAVQQVRAAQSKARENAHTA